MNSTSDQLLQPTTSSTTDRSLRKTKSPPSSPSSPSTKWRSEKQQQIYTTKLARALTKLQPPSSQSSPSRNGRAVREVSDRALAVTARGKTLWSRAILSKAVKLKLRKHKRQRISNPVTTGSSRSKTVTRVKAKGVQRKVKTLGRLVPGCSKQTLPVVLEETTDYIAAMEMQIRAMTAILSAVSSSPTTGHEGGQTHVLG